MSERVDVMRASGVDGCEWNPDVDTPAYDTDEHHRTTVATLIVGADGQWRLCDSCAALPRFSRFSTRKRIKTKRADSGTGTPEAETVGSEPERSPTTRWMSAEGAMRLLGWQVVKEDVLPPGEGVAESEVGMPGPWYGVTNGTVTIGWERSPSAPNAFDAAFSVYSNWRDVCGLLVERLDRDRSVTKAAKQLIAVIDSEPDGPILKADGQPPWKEVSELIRALVESRSMEHPDEPTGGA